LRTQTLATSDVILRPLKKWKFQNGINSITASPTGNSVAAVLLTNDAQIYKWDPDVGISLF